MAKNKVARHRCVQMISHLGEIEYVLFILRECTTDVSDSEDMYNDLRDALMECWRLSFAHTLLLHYLNSSAVKRRRWILQNLLQSLETDPAC